MQFFLAANCDNFFVLKTFSSIALKVRLGQRKTRAQKLPE